MVATAASIVVHVKTVAAARRGRASASLMNVHSFLFGVKDGSTFSTCRHGSPGGHGNHRNYREGNEGAEFSIVHRYTSRKQTLK